LKGKRLVFLFCFLLSFVGCVKQKAAEEDVADVSPKGNTTGSDSTTSSEPQNYMIFVQKSFINESGQEYDRVSIQKLSSDGQITETDGINVMRDSVRLRYIRVRGNHIYIEKYATNYSVKEIYKVNADGTFSDPSLSFICNSSQTGIDYCEHRGFSSDLKYVVESKYDTYIRPSSINLSSYATTTMSLIERPSQSFEDVVTYESLSEIYWEYTQSKINRYNLLTGQTLSVDLSSSPSVTCLHGQTSLSFFELVKDQNGESVLFTKDCTKVGKIYNSTNDEPSTFTYLTAAEEIRSVALKNDEYEKNNSNNYDVLLGSTNNIYLYNFTAGSIPHNQQSEKTFNVCGNIQSYLADGHFVTLCDGYVKLYKLNDLDELELKSTVDTMDYLSRFGSSSIVKVHLMQF
jgi:hypothetical protein